MTAWILVNEQRIPISRSMYELYDGFSQLGEEIKLYTTQDVENEKIPYSKDDIVVGHIHHCKKHVKKITGKEIETLDYPECLNQFYNRDIKTEKLGYIKQLMTIEKPKPIFVKSVDQKYITGFICRSFSDYLNKCHCDENVDVYISDVLDIKSEYRAYVHWHSIVDCRRYTGDFSLVPNINTLNTILDLLKNEKMPCSYSIDVGILNTGETIIVECNDGFALGNYGIHARKYADMHRDRWYQMVE